MEVQMNSQESGLKEILSEVGEELQVHLYGEVEAMLWFPEYYEEGVENTPARILMTEVHGSGLYYRNCFQGKVFLFLEYDKRFELARAQESPDFLREMVYGRLYWPVGLTAKAKAQYEQYLQAYGTDRFSVYPAEAGQRAGMASSYLPFNAGPKRAVCRSYGSGKCFPRLRNPQYADGIPESPFSIQKEKL